MTLDEKITAGKFIYINDDITRKNFPRTTNSQEVEIMGFPKAMESNDIIELMDKKNFRPASLDELLNWWLANPDKQKDCFVFALGSAWDGLVPYVNGHGGDRSLGLGTLANGFGTYCTFAVVRKSDTGTLGAVENSLEQRVAELEKWRESLKKIDW